MSSGTGREGLLNWVEIDLSRIERNVAELVRFAAGTPLLVVVKADAYGHGMLPVAHRVLTAGARFLGVGNVDEGRTLRRDGILAPILVLQPPLPDQVLLAVSENLRVTVTNRREALAVSEAACRVGRKAFVHLKVDTGMGRFGATVQEAEALLKYLLSLPGVHVEGVFSHLSCVDEPGHPLTPLQIQRFRQLMAACSRVCPHPLMFHLANSGAFFLHSDIRLDLCRIGLAAYGIYPVKPEPAHSLPAGWPQVEPAMSLHARVVAVREMADGWPIGYGATHRVQGRTRVAVVAAGYANGVSRRLSNRGRVLIRGRSCSIVGRVCMNQTMVALPGDLPVEVGDEAVFLGRQGDQVISVEEWCQHLDTIPHEILCQVGAVRPRLYRSRDGAPSP